MYPTGWSRHSSTSWPPTHRGCPRGRRRCPTPKWCMNAARRRPHGRAHCHVRALFTDHNPQLPMQLEVLSTARDASVAGMERKDEVGHATSAAGAQRDCTHQSEGSHPPAQETWPLPPDSPVLCASRGYFGGFLSQPTFVGHLHLAVVPTSTRSGMRSSAARIHA